MPGLPRKSTSNQFKKLMKKSGKSKTNKSSGGVNPHKKIATFEQFSIMRENTRQELGPYGEEDWDYNEPERRSTVRDLLDLMDSIDIRHVRRTTTKNGKKTNFLDKFFHKKNDVFVDSFIIGHDNIDTIGFVCSKTWR